MPHRSPVRLEGSSRAAGGQVLVALLVLLASVASASTSAVVGFYNVAVPAGNSAWVSGLVGADLYQGAAATVTADVDGKALVQFTAPGWTTNAFNLHYAEPQSGICAGLAIDILSNTADTLKLNITPAAAGLTSGMVFIVRKHATLGGLIPDGGGLVPFNDTISLFGTTGLQTTYFYNSFSHTWITVLGDDATNAIVRPGQGFVIQVSSPLTLTLGKGEICFVKTTATKVAISPNVPNLVGALNPLGSSTTTLGSMGLINGLQIFNDSVVTLSAGSLAQTGTFLSTGSGLVDSGTGASADGNTVTAGASVVVNVNAQKNITLSPVTVSP